MHSSIPDSLPMLSPGLVNGSSTSLEMALQCTCLSKDTCFFFCILYGIAMHTFFSRKYSLLFCISYGILPNRYNTHETHARHLSLILPYYTITYTRTPMPPSTISPTTAAPPLTPCWAPLPAPSAAAPPPSSPSSASLSPPPCPSPRAA